MAGATGATNRPQSRRGGFKGSTSRAYGSAILGSPFWQVGTEVCGAYIGSFETANGECFKFKALQPSSIKVMVDDAGRVVEPSFEGAKERTVDQFAVGSMAGFTMALDDMKANGWKGFALHDRVWIKCVEIQPASQPGYSDMPMFEVEVE